MNGRRTKVVKICIGDITFDVFDTSAMAHFWAAALHYEVQVVTPDFASIVDPAGDAPRCFQRTATDKTGKNRVHLDLHTSDMDTEVERLMGLGAQRVRQDADGDVVWTVMLDIEGNEFCVQPPPEGANAL